MHSGLATAAATAPWPWQEAKTSPEARLMLAVLQDALAVFQRGLQASRRHDVETFLEVDRWLRSRDDDWIFSFESICSELRIDAGRLRLLLNELRRQALAEPKPRPLRKPLRQRILTRRSWRGRIG